MIDPQFFTYSPIDGFEIHKTAADARRHAEAAMMVCEPRDIFRCCWGQVIGRVVTEWRDHRPQYRMEDME